METNRKQQDRTRSLSDLRAEVEALQTAQSAPVASVEEIEAGFKAMASIMHWTDAEVRKMAEASHKKLADAQERGNNDRISELLAVIGVKEIPAIVSEFFSLIFGHRKDGKATYTEVKSRIPANKGNKAVFMITVDLNTDSVTDCKVSFPRGNDDTPSVSA